MKVSRTSGILVWLGVIGGYGSWLLVIAMLLCFANVLSCDWRGQEDADREERRQIIDKLVQRHGAIVDWDNDFVEEGIALDEGHRPVYREDVERRVLRADGKPLLVHGYVFEVRRSDGKAFIGLDARCIVDIDFMLKCDESFLDMVLKQPVGDDDVFAAIVAPRAIKRPLFEADAYLAEEDWDEEAAIVIEPGDT